MLLASGASRHNLTGSLALIFQNYISCISKVHLLHNSSSVSPTNCILHTLKYSIYDSKMFCCPCKWLPSDSKSLLLLTGDNYYGEYPLAFAACFGHEVIYDYLIDHGADPNLHDSFGNTVLHMLVINNQIVSMTTFHHPLISATPYRLSCQTCHTEVSCC